MKGKRVALLTLFAAALAAVAIEPAAAQSADTTTERLIWNLNNQLMYIAVPITILVEAILFYTVWKFRNNESPLPTKENRRLEITWTVATAIILLFVGVASYQVLADPFVTATPDTDLDTVTDGEEEEALEVQVTAQKYNWQFYYPESDVTNANTLVLPSDRPVRLNITSTDWLHAFHVPSMGLKQDAFPGQSNYLITEATDTGEHQLYCAEYCGVGHSQMLGTVEVRSQEDFDSWLAENGAAGDSGNATAGNATSALAP
ncbi:cytochrome c oxidase subunit II [Halosimplex litoreum]|uniref:cytochrome-c oxidase n=1 Tax=Halosimplex litoreum TaxID=1198301 RepID=A0A7T3G057_9EURY|nr:cytochrome c oxidase subunit II [Halosimplex litoreum]QPV63949.1 cytochrome c oxidase subunit II [Halosimplex litoreum]